MHIDYSLKKNELDKYFHYEICADNLTFEQKKPNPKGIIDIIRHCPYKSIKYIGANVDDIICAKNANIENIGVVNIKTDKTAKINNFRHLGANYIIENSDEIIKFLDKNEQK